MRYVRTTAGHSGWHGVLRRTPARGDDTGGQTLSALYGEVVSRGDSPGEETPRGLVYHHSDRGRVPGAVREGPPAEAGILDQVLLGRARDALDSLNLDDPAEMTVQVADLAARLCELWDCACDSSQRHQSVLALAEGAAMSWSLVTEGQVEALRMAIDYLCQDELTDTHVDLLRSRLIDEGYNPFALLGPPGDEHE